ncbi:c-type cytochrome [Aromatoleum petrolei]|uniref:Cytochrome c n=2 Tax=Aromatoleum petrolei TaxID=76116 RepID=A0ABX1MQ60_9RHOO|nr:cytochrome c [Aromatoleum petrolei]NMF88259.1 cytochrome c [Aromatoleum petrolei]QTQ38039.1 putative cytochrome c, class I [Aromatoleum petrolei]
MYARRLAVCLGTLAALTAAGGAQAEWRDGGEVYDKVCRYCHEANVGPVLKGRALPEEYVRRVVRMGNRAMPAFRPTEIDDATLADVARRINGSEALARE